MDKRGKVLENDWSDDEILAGNFFYSSPSNSREKTCVEGRKYYENNRGYNSSSGSRERNEGRNRESNLASRRDIEPGRITDHNCIQFDDDDDDSIEMIVDFNRDNSFNIIDIVPSREKDRRLVMDYNKKYNDDDNKGLKIAWYRELESRRRLARASWMDSVKGRRHLLTSAPKRIFRSENPARERPHQIALVERADLNRLYEEIDVLEQQRSGRARCSVRKVVNEKKDLRTHSARDPDSDPAKRGKAVALLNPTNDVLGEEVVQVELDLYSRNDLYSR